VTLPKPRPDDPLVIQVMQEYRAKLDDMDITTMNTMATRWIQIEHGLEAEIAALAEEMVRRQAQGEAITQQMIFKAQRYQIIKAELTEEIRKYNKNFAVDLITTSQEQYATLGIDAAQNAIISMYPSPLSASFNRINVEAVQAMMGFAGDGSPLYSLLKEDYPDAVDGLLDALINGLGRGLGSGQIAKDMADGMGMGLDRALLIARTELARAYRTGSVQQYRDSGVVVGFRRLVKKATACPSCLFLDGEHFDLASELYDHPRGKCTAIPDIEGMKPATWQLGKDWFTALDPAQQREIMGNTKYEAWKEGLFKLKDLSRVTDDATWGKSPRVATLAELGIK